MKKYDLYINEKKPSIGLYVPNGSSLPDFADPRDWIFHGTAEQDLLPSSVVEGVEANGHARFGPWGSQNARVFRSRLCLLTAHCEKITSGNLSGERSGSRKYRPMPSLRLKL